MLLSISCILGLIIKTEINQSINPSIHPSNYFIVRPKVDQGAGQLIVVWRT